jgi:hypothetical protein
VGVLAMNISGPGCMTWHDVLIEKGFEPSVSESLIGFISWNREKGPAKLGENITKALSGYKGTVFAVDTVSINYNDRGLLFVSAEISEETAKRMFEAIMEYEQQVVYKI